MFTIEQPSEARIKCKPTAQRTTFDHNVHIFFYMGWTLNSQAISHNYVPCSDFVIRKQTVNYIIYNTDEIYNTDKKRIKIKIHNTEILFAPKPEMRKYKLLLL